MQETAVAVPYRNEDLQPLNVDVWRNALLKSPTAENLIQTGEALFMRGQGVDALRLALELVSLHPAKTTLVMAAAGMISKHTSRHDIVATLMRNVLAHEPNNLNARMFLADAIMAGGDITGGCRIFSEMMEQYPGQRTSLCEHISMSLLEAGYTMEALQVLSFWLKEVDPNAALLNNMGCALERLGQSALAVPWYEKAMTLAPENPTISFGYSMALLKSGNYREGWPYYAKRVPITNGVQWWFMSLPRLRHGDDLAGKKVILYQEQGLGDTLQFIRSVPYLVEQGAEVTLAILPSLRRLLELSYPDVTIRLIREFAPAEGYDYAAPIPDLPYIAGVMSESEVPAPIPYLRADAADVARFAATMPPRRPRIGLVWAGERRVQSEHVAADKRRSTTLAQMGAALCPVDATLVNLQFGAPRSEITQWQGQPLFDPMGEVRDMADTAAIMESIDLLISVDTSPVHLAGALGRPVWLVSRWDACWRWGDTSDTSPWYPGMRVFRAREKSFDPVLQEVGAALQQWVKAWKAD